MVFLNIECHSVNLWITPKWCTQLPQKYAPRPKDVYQMCALLLSVHEAIRRCMDPGMVDKFMWALHRTRWTRGFKVFISDPPLLDDDWSLKGFAVISYEFLIYSPSHDLVNFSLQGLSIIQVRQQHSIITNRTYAAVIHCCILSFAIL
jgi:hypothetical protein